MGSEEYRAGFASEQQGVRNEPTAVPRDGRRSGGTERDDQRGDQRSAHRDDDLTEEESSRVQHVADVALARVRGSDDTAKSQAEYIARHKLASRQTTPEKLDTMFRVARARIGQEFGRRRGNPEPANTPSEMARALADEGPRDDQATAEGSNSDGGGQPPTVES